MSYEDFAEEEDFSLNSQKEKESRYLRIQRDSILGRRRQKIQSVKQISFIYGRYSEKRSINREN